jgi:opacity protein-like surface antigen
VKREKANQSKTLMLGAVIACSLFSVAVAAQAMPQTAGPSHIDPAQSLDDSVNKGFVLYFRTTDYSSIVCTEPRASADANLISHGASLFNDAQADAQWMEHQKDVKNCWSQAPNQRFEVTQATPLYLNSAMVEWVVGVKVPTTGKVIGYIPIAQIQIIPIATL